MCCGLDACSQKSGDQYRTGMDGGQLHSQAVLVAAVVQGLGNVIRRSIVTSCALTE
jgi:hypothetical protein